MRARRARRVSSRNDGCLRARPVSGGCTRCWPSTRREPGEVVVGIETDRGLWVAALVEAGYQVYAINPLAASRYRDRHAVSGAKSDPGDARVLADLVRTDRHQHRPVAADSTLAEAVKVLARAHQSLVWTRQRQLAQLRSTLREFYPQALMAFAGELGERDALAVLARAPRPAEGRASVALRAALDTQARGAASATSSTKRSANPDRAAQRATRRHAARSRARLQPACARRSPITQEITRQLDQLERELADAFMHHPDAEILRSLPGLGLVLGARVLAEFGDAPNRYKDAKAPPLLRRHRPHHPRLRHPPNRARPPRQKPPTGRRLLPLGIRRAHPLTRSPRPLRPPTPTRSDPPPSPPRARQPARRHPPRLPPTPHHLQRNDRLGTRHSQPAA